MHGFVVEREEVEQTPEHNAVNEGFKVGEEQGGVAEDAKPDDGLDIIAWEKVTV